MPSECCTCAKCFNDQCPAVESIFRNFETWPEDLDSTLLEWCFMYAKGIRHCPLYELHKPKGVTCQSQSNRQTLVKSSI